MPGVAKKIHRAVNSVATGGLMKRLPSKSHRQLAPVERGNQLGYSRLYSDANIIAIQKKPFLHTYKTNNPNHLTLEKTKPENSFITHSLDKRVGGLMILAKNKHTAKRLIQRFQDNYKIKHYFTALTSVPLEKTVDVIKSGLVKTNKDKISIIEYHPAFKDMRYPDENKIQEAITKYKVLATSLSGSFLRLEKNSNATHQLRVHCSSILSSPIIGDFTYGYKSPYYHDAIFSDPRNLNLYLHSSRIILEDWFEKGAHLDLIAPLPEFFLLAARKLDLKEGSRRTLEENDIDSLECVLNEEVLEDGELSEI